MAIEEEKLIFIISQPRAGSTLLQRILGKHSQIHTVAEPWIMLNPVFALPGKGNKSDSATDKKALKLFLQELPNGQEDFFEGIRLMYKYLYAQALKPSGKSYFLDKTPRYYYIIKELYSIFPRAKFIILLRNPVAVLNSIIKTWVRGDWFLLGKYYRDDLIKAPYCLASGKRELKEKVYTLHYETLIAEPEKVVGQLCEYIGINFEYQMLDFAQGSLKQFKLGDPQNIYQNKTVNSSNLGGWIDDIKTFPQVWHFCKEYLGFLRENNLLSELGYSYKEIDKTFNENCPKSFNFKIPLSWALNKQNNVKPFTQEALFRKYFYKRRSMEDLISKKGYSQTFLYLLKKSFL